jgi:hypothetical protein
MQEDESAYGGNDEGITKAEARDNPSSLGHSCFSRHLLFVIRHFPPFAPKARAAAQTFSPRPAFAQVPTEEPQLMALSLADSHASRVGRSSDFRAASPGLLTAKKAAMAQESSEASRPVTAAGTVPEFHRSSLFVGRPSQGSRPPTHNNTPPISRAPPHVSRGRKTPPKREFSRIGCEGSTKDQAPMTSGPSGQASLVTRWLPAP